MDTLQRVVTIFLFILIGMVVTVKSFSKGLTPIRLKRVEILPAYSLLNRSWKNDYGAKGVWDLNMKVNFDMFCKKKARPRRHESGCLMFWDNEILSMQDTYGYAFVGWTYNVGFYITNFLKVYFHHFSGHRVDRPWAGHAFPYENAIGWSVRLY